MNIAKILFVWCIFFSNQKTPSYGTPDARRHVTFKVINGTKAYSGSFPGQVSIQNRSNFHFCGGTLITLLHILTASHCFKPWHEESVNEFKLIADELNKKDASPFRQTRAVKLILQHPFYNPTTLLNDIAVLVCTEPFVRTSTLRPIEMPKVLPTVGEECLAAGWGQTDPKRQPSYSDILLFVKLKIIEPRVCEDVYTTAIFKSKTMICAGELMGSVDTCSGDSGGPLICNGSLSGIVSFGYDCGVAYSPGVYTNVKAYLNWIEIAIKSSQYSRIDNQL